MATVNYSVDNTQGGAKIVTWTGLTTTNNDGQPFSYPVFADRAVQVKGTFGVGGTVVIEGSNDTSSATYAILSDPTGDSLSLTSGVMRQVLENAYSIRPRVTAGDGTTSLTVKILLVTPTGYDLHIPNG